TRLKRRERVDIGLLLRRVHAPRRERDLRVVAGFFRNLLDRRAAAENDQIGKRNLLAALSRGVELILDRFELLQDSGQMGWLIDVPIFLRRKANARAVRAAALVGTAERGRRRPSRRDELGSRRELSP